MSRFQTIAVVAAAALCVCISGSVRAAGIPKPAKLQKQLQENHETPAIDPVADAIVELLVDATLDNTSESIEALHGAVADFGERSVPSLERVQSDNLAVKKHVIACLATLAENAEDGSNASYYSSASLALGIYLEDKDDEIREYTASLVDKMGRIPALESYEMLYLLFDSDEKVREIAARFFDTHGSGAFDATEAAVNILKDPQSTEDQKTKVCRIVGKIGPDAKPANDVLAAILQDKENGKSLRIEAAITLGKLRRNEGTGMNSSPF